MLRSERSERLEAWQREAFRFLPFETDASRPPQGEVSVMNWGTMSRDERDAAYNNTDAVKNSAALNEAREAASATFRKAHPEHLSRPYGRRERNKWDLFPARIPTRRASSSFTVAIGSATA